MALSPGINGSTIQTVRELCGAEIAARLVDNFGGLKLYIPHSPPKTGRLTSALDSAALESLCLNLGGEIVVVPIGRRSAARRTRQRVENMLRDGKSSSHIARRAGCCIRTVFGIKAEMRSAGELPPRGRTS